MGRIRSQNKLLANETSVILPNLQNIRAFYQVLQGFASAIRSNQRRRPDSQPPSCLSFLCLLIQVYILLSLLFSLFLFCLFYRGNPFSSRLHCMFICQHDVGGRRGVVDKLSNDNYDAAFLSSMTKTSCLFPLVCIDFWTVFDNKNC